MKKHQPLRLIFEKSLSLESSQSLRQRAKLCGLPLQNHIAKTISADAGKNDTNEEESSKTSVKKSHLIQILATHYENISRWSQNLDSVNLQKQHQERTRTHHDNLIHLKSVVGIDVGLKNMGIVHLDLQINKDNKKMMLSPTTASISSPLSVNQPVINETSNSYLFDIHIHDWYMYQVESRSGYHIKNYSQECFNLIQTIISNNDKNRREINTTTYDHHTINGLPDIFAIEKQILPLSGSSLHGNSKMLSWEALLFGTLFTLRNYRHLLQNQNDGYFSLTDGESMNTNIKEIGEDRISFSNLTEKNQYPFDVLSIPSNTVSSLFGLKENSMKIHSTTPPSSNPVNKKNSIKVIRKKLKKEYTCDLVQNSINQGFLSNSIPCIVDLPSIGLTVSESALSNWQKMNKKDDLADSLLVGLVPAIYNIQSFHQMRKLILSPISKQNKKNL